ncbi:hypothetical protein D3C76_1225400 [compost metagenome]
MTVLLLAQFGIQAGAVRIQASQFGFFGRAFEVPGMGGVAGIVTFYLQQLDLTAHGGKLGLFGRVGLAQVADFIAASVQLRLQAILGQLGRGQALIEQRPLGQRQRKAPLQRPGQPQARQCGCQQAQQNTGQIQNHRHSLKADAQKRCQGISKQRRALVVVFSFVTLRAVAQPAEL